MYSKYWLIESSQGLDGLENVRRLSYEEALAIARDIFEGDEDVDVYPSTAYELEVLGVDIY